MSENDRPKPIVEVSWEALKEKELAEEDLEEESGNTPLGGLEAPLDFNAEFERVYEPSLEQQLEEFLDTEYQDPSSED